MDSKTLATSLHKLLKDQGHEMPLGHVYEALSKLSGHKSWNVAKEKGFGPVIKAIKSTGYRSETTEKNTQTSIRMAEAALDELEIVANEGLNPVYSSMDEYLMDWYMDLPWDADGLMDSIMHLMTNKRAAKVSKMINDKFGFDILKSWHDMGYIIEGTEGIEGSSVTYRHNYEVKVNASVIAGGSEIELKKYYNVVAKDEDQARATVQNYLDFRNGDTEELSSGAKFIATMEDEDSFQHKNWEVIYLSDVDCKITDVLKK